jgi:hypothetical protein
MKHILAPTTLGLITILPISFQDPSQLAKPAP